MSSCARYPPRQTEHTFARIPPEKKTSGVGVDDGPHGARPPHAAPQETGETDDAELQSN